MRTKRLPPIKKLDWHTPKIADFGIRVPANENTWANLLKIIGGQPVFAVVFPGVEITPTGLHKKRAYGRERSRRARDRARTAPRFDPARCYPVPLRDSEVNALAAKFKAKQGDELITEHEWRCLVGTVIADLVRSVIRKK